MKKILLLATAVALVLSGCGSENNSNSERFTTEEKRVIEIFKCSAYFGYSYYFFSKEVGDRNSADASGRFARAWQLVGLQFLNELEIEDARKQFLQDFSERDAEKLTEDYTNEDGTFNLTVGEMGSILKRSNQKCITMMNEDGRLYKAIDSRLR